MNGMLTLFHVACLCEGLLAVLHVDEHAAAVHFEGVAETVAEVPVAEIVVVELVEIVVGELVETVAVEFVVGLRIAVDGLAGTVAAEVGLAEIVAVLVGIAMD